MTLGEIMKKYKEMDSKGSEYVSVRQVIQDISQMRKHQQVLKIPKRLR